MQTAAHIPTTDAIIARAARIGLPISRLAIDAGLNASTVSRWKSATNGSNAGSLRKMADKLEEREREMLDYLLQMYPEAAIRQEEDA
jgi:hypothetical protein